MTRTPGATMSASISTALVAQMSDTQPLDLNSAALGIGRHVSGIADPLQRPYRRVPHLPRPALRRLDRDHLEHHEQPGAFAVAGAEEQKGGGGEPPPLAGAGVIVCLMG